MLKISVIIKNLLLKILLITLLLQNIAGATGDNVVHAWKDEALSGTLALAQSKIGDIAQDKGLKSGSLGKTALHSGAGSLYSLATGSTALSGAIGGASSELVAGIMESGSGLNGPPSDVPLTPEQAKINADKRINLNNNIKATTKLASATATLLAGGNAKDITLSANVGESAVKHNRRLHLSEEQVLAELQKGKTPEEQRRLELAAKYLVRASAGTPKKDKQHSPLSQDEIEGSKYIEEQKMLSSLAKERNKSLQWAQTMEVAKLAEGLSGDLDKYTQRTFDYTAGDYMEDLISSKGSETVFRFEHGEEAFVGAIGSLTLKGASKIVSTMPFGLGDETATTLDGASHHLLEHAVTHGFGLIEPEYKPTEGSIVQASFKGAVKDSYTSEHASSLLSIGTIGISSTIKGAAKLGKIVPKAFKSTAVTKEPALSSLTTGMDSGTLYENGTSSRIGISEIDRAIKKAEHKEVVGVKGAKADALNKQPYDSRAMETMLVESNPGKKITSSTLPKTSDPNVRLAGTKHKEFDVVFDRKGFPIFDDVAIYDTRVSMEVVNKYSPSKVKLSQNVSSEQRQKIIKNNMDNASSAHMRAATRDLRDKINQGIVDKSQFTKAQLEDIKAGKKTIDNLIWHHHQDTGRMQLIPEKLHENVKHPGGMSLWYEK